MSRACKRRGEASPKHGNQRGNQGKKSSGTPQAAPKITTIRGIIAMIDKKNAKSYNTADRILLFFVAIIAAPCVLICFIAIVLLTNWAWGLVFVFPIILLGTTCNQSWKKLGSWPASRCASICTIAILFPIAFPLYFHIDYCRSAQPDLMLNDDGMLEVSIFVSKIFFLLFASMVFIISYISFRSILKNYSFFRFSQGVPEGGADKHSPSTKNKKIGVLILLFTYVLIVVLTAYGSFTNRSVINEKIISNTLSKNEAKYYLSIRWNDVDGEFDPSRDYWLLMNIEQKGEINLRRIESHRRITEEELRQQLQKKYEIEFTNNKQVIYIRQKTAPFGVFLIGFLGHFIPATKNTLGKYILPASEASKKIPTHLELSKYDSFYFVDEKIESEEYLFSDNKRSLIILGANFENDEPVYSKGDIYLQGATERRKGEDRSLTTIVSESTIILNDPKKEIDRDDLMCENIINIDHNEKNTK